MARGKIDEDDTEELNIGADGDDDGEREDGDDGDDGEEADDGSELSDDDGDEEDADEEADGEDGEEEEGEDGDGDEEGDGEEEEADEDLEALAAEADTPDTVPYSRFKEVNDRLKALEAGQPAKGEDGSDIPAFDMAAKLKEKNEALLEGDVDKATAIDLEVAKHQQLVADARADARAQKNRQEESIQKVVRQVQKKYPQLDDSKGNKAFSAETLAEVVALRNGYIAGGMPVQSALMKAADRLLGKGGKPAAKQEDPKGKDGKKKLSDQEKLRRILRAKRAGQQPASPTGKRGDGNRTSKAVDWASIKVEDLSDAQLTELERTNPKLLARLQGDVV